VTSSLLEEAVAAEIVLLSLAVNAKTAKCADPGD